MPQDAMGTTAEGITMQLDAYTLRPDDHQTVAFVPPMEEPQHSTPALDQDLNVKVRSPKPAPARRVPYALTMNSPYLRTARAKEPQPDSPRTLARKELKRVVRSLHVHEARKLHGVGGDKYGKKPTKHRMRIKLPPPLPKADLYSSASAPALLQKPSSASPSVAGDSYYADSVATSPRSARQPAMSIASDASRGLAEHMLGPETINRWLQDCQPHVKVAEEAAPIGFAPDGSLLHRAPSPPDSAGWQGSEGGSEASARVESVFEGDSFVDGDRVMWPDTAGASRRGVKPHTNAMRATRTQLGGFQHVPSSQPAGSGPVTPSAPPQPHRSLHGRAARSMREQGGEEQQQQQSSRRRRQAPRHLSPLPEQAKENAISAAAPVAAATTSSASVPYRMDPGYYLVDRQALPERMPQSMLNFWERNPQLLPKDALSPANFKRLPPRMVVRHRLGDTAPHDLSATSSTLHAAAYSPRTQALAGSRAGKVQRQRVVEKQRSIEREGVRYNYGVMDFDVSSSGKLRGLPVADQAAQLSGSVTGIPGVRSGLGTTSGVADVEIMGVSVEMKDQLAHTMLGGGAGQGVIAGTRGSMQQQMFQQHAFTDDPWRDEMGSQLARPLDASVFLHPNARLAMHPSTSKAFDPDAVGQPPDGRFGLFPYGEIAHEASTCIQRAWFRYIGRRDRGALMLQKLYRGYAVRKPFRVAYALSTSAATMAQSVLRMKLGKNRAHRRWCEVVYPKAAKFQSAWRGLQGRRRAARVRSARDNRCAAAVQRVMRGHLGRVKARVRALKVHMRTRMLRMRYSILLQRLARGYIGRCRARHRLSFAVRIMEWWRKVVARNLAAAKLLQCMARGFMARRRVKHMRATTMQRIMRGALARARVKRLRAALEAAERERFAAECVAVQTAGDFGANEKLDFLATKNGKAAVKAEVAVVKKGKKELAARRKAMTKNQRRKDEAKESFQIYDVDASGSIDLEEFRYIMEELCQPYTKASLQAAFNAIDEDGSGEIDVFEFIKWYVVGEDDDEEEEDESEDEDDAHPDETELERRARLAAAGGGKKKGVMSRFFGGKSKKKSKKKKKKGKGGKKKLSAAQKKKQEMLEKRKRTSRKGQKAAASDAKREEEAQLAAKAGAKDGGGSTLQAGAPDANMSLKLMRLRLRGKRAVKDLLGVTTKKKATFNLVYAARNEAAAAARSRFRRSRKPPFACETCIRTFAFKSSLTAHNQEPCDPRDQVA